MTDESNRDKAIAFRLAEGSIFRPAIGLLCVVGSLLGFAALYIVEVPTANADILNLALGIIFGWGSAVVQSEYGATSTGRKAADSAIRGLDKIVEEKKP